MPKRYAGFSFRNLGDNNDKRYNSDHVDKYQVESRFQIPVHMQTLWTANNSNAVAAAIGAFPTYYRDSNGEKQLINDFGSEVCAVGNELKPRKIKFIFSNGNSTAVPIGASGTGIKDTYTELKGIFQVGGITVVCAHLIGEEWAQLNEIAGVAFDPSEATAPAGNGKYYSGTLTQYKSEINGATELLSVRILTNAGVPPGSALPPIFTAAADCIGAVIEESATCPGRAETIETRRVIVKYKSDAVRNVYEQREAPIKEIGATLKTCLTNLGARPGVYCISYRGESRKNIHLLP